MEGWGGSLSEFLHAFIHYAFHLENYAVVESLFEGYDSFTEWEYRVPSMYVCTGSAERVCVPLTAVAERRGRQKPPWAGR